MYVYNNTCLDMANNRRLSVVYVSIYRVVERSSGCNGADGGVSCRSVMVVINVGEFVHSQGVSDRSRALPTSYLPQAVSLDSAPEHAIGRGHLTF